MPLPKKVIIPLQQHTGKACEPVVAVGDEVKAGQVIARSTGFISAPVHAAITGKVTAIEEQPHPLAFTVKAIVIEQTGEQAASDEWNSIYDWQNLSAKELRDKIHEAGIVGMGGAAFPTHVKLSPPEGKKIDLVILNGVECEPFLTNDHRLMLEKPEEIIEGLLIIMKILGVSRAVIGIEKNKPDAISRLADKVFQRHMTDVSITVTGLKVKYPQGAEKQLIKAVANREVPSGGLPFDVNVVVQNVGTAFAIYEAVVKNKPLIERVLTVSGDGVAYPKNIRVRIGTQFSEILAFAGGTTVDHGPHKTIMGGPMMGIAQYNMAVPVIKGTSGILVLKEGKKKKTRACIKCGRCADHCPMRLMPNRLGDFSERNDFNSAKEFNIRDCMECGVCTYVCPSARPLVHLVKYAKLNLAAASKKE